MQRNRTVKGLLGLALVAAMLLSVLPTLVAPAAATAAETWYVSYLGGSAGDYGNGIAVDGTGNIYIAGYTGSTNFPTTPGAYQTAKSAGDDAYMCKFDSTGNLVYSTYLGGSGTDYAQRVVVDGAGNACVVGRTNSADFPTTAGAFQTANAGGYDAYIAKFDSSGNLIYSTYLGGSGTDYGFGIAVDGAGNMCVAGYTNSANFPTTSGAYQTANAGGNDAYVAKFDSTGNRVYSTYIGGTGADYGRVLTVDATGGIHLAGYTASTNFPTTIGAYQTTNAGGNDVFLVDFDSSGNPVYSTYIGGTTAEYVYGVAVDDTGNIYLAGRTDSANFPTTPGAFQTANAGGYDAYIAKFNSSRNLVYGTYLGGTLIEYAYDIAVDGTGNIYVAGYTGSTNFPTTPGAFQTANAGGDDAFMSRFDASGNLDYSTYLGGASSTDWGQGIAINGVGDVCITGQTNSSTFPITEGAYQTTLGGSSDTFFARVTTTVTPTTYTIAASAGANGAIDPSGSVVVSEGASQSFAIIPAIGYHVSDVLVDSVSVSAVTSYEFTSVTANHTIEASFAIDTFTITASAGANGSIDPVGDVTVDYGASQSFTISASTGYHVVDVLVDGASVGAVTSYEFTNVAANHTISVSFAVDVPAWDLNGDHTCNIGDVVVIGLVWGQTGAPGWIPEDLNSDGAINIGDVVVLGLHWGETW